MEYVKGIWVKYEIGDEERVACSECGEYVTDQKVSLKIDFGKKLVEYVQCEECDEKWKKMMKTETEHEGDR